MFRLRLPSVRQRKLVCSDPRIKGKLAIRRRTLAGLSGEGGPRHERARLRGRHERSRDESSRTPTATPGGSARRCHVARCHRDESLWERAARPVQGAPQRDGSCRVGTASGVVISLLEGWRDGLVPSRLVESELRYCSRVASCVTHPWRITVPLRSETSMVSDEWNDLPSALILMRVDDLRRPDGVPSGAYVKN